MDPVDFQGQVGWREENSRTFLEYGRYFIPERELQIEILCDLIPPHPEPFDVLDLGCGEGLLAGALLKRFPTCTVYGYDSSPAMLDRARANLARYGERFQPRSFDLASSSWRSPRSPVDAVVSSLASHHLDNPQKQTLFHDVHRMLAERGVFVIADLVAPAGALAAGVAARLWDAAVRRRSRAIGGDTRAFDAFEREKWNTFRYPPPPDDIDHPARVFDQLKWLELAGFVDVDVYWMYAGHAILGGRKETKNLA